MTLTVGPRARALIEHFEGCVLHAYLDTGGIPTIGYGATGLDVRMGMTWTLPQADARLATDLARFAGYVIPLLQGAPTTPAQFGALVSAAYNAGPGNLAKSPMLAAHKSGDTLTAAASWLNWHVRDHAGNKLVGLQNRRDAEARLYSTGDWE
jgi:lysozyme